MDRKVIQTKPLISVIIPNFNRENVIYDTICNVLSQTYENIEVIVVDDCSSDNSLNEIKKVKDDRLLYITSDMHRGANACRNAGVKASHGEYIAFQDSGTFWKKDKLEKQLNRLRESPDAALVYCIIKIDKEEESVCEPEESLELCYKEERCAEKLAHGNIIDTPTIMLTRQCFQEVGGFDEELLRWQDYDFVIRVVSNYRIVIVNEILAETKNYANSITANLDFLVKSVPVILKKNRIFFDTYGSTEEIINGIVWHIGLSRLSYLSCIKYFEYLNEQLKNVAENKVMDCVGEFFDFIRKRDGLDNPYTIYNFKCFINKVYQGQHFMIYGAGQVALRLIMQFKEINCADRIEKIVVTNKKEENILEDIPIISLNELIDGNELPVLIGVAEKTQLEIFHMLCKKGFTNIYIMQDEFWKYIV